MKLFIIFSICIAAAMSNVAMTSNEEFSFSDSSTIHHRHIREAENPSDSSDFQFPYMVSLHYKGYFVCSSFLVTPKFLMTTANCVVFYRNNSAKDPKDFRAYMGTANRDGPDNEATFSDIIVHEKFVSRIDYDIAIMKLKSPAVLSSNIQPICLPTKDSVYESITALAIGWGLRHGTNSDRTARTSETLKMSKERVPTNSKCDTTYRELYPEFDSNVITRRQVCAGGELNRGICFGDTGAPLVIMSESKPVAIGIAAFMSYLGCGSDVPAVFTATATFNDWILEHMGEDASDLCFVNKTSTPT